ncbi:membrane progestin receptor beta [Neosynchiropus ocellatus]
MPHNIIHKLISRSLDGKHRTHYSLPWPSSTVTASDVPPLFREPHILSGYRPVHQKWFCYLFSLFQEHNESLNVWTHLLAVPVVLIRWWVNALDSGYTLDIVSLPLSVFLASALVYVFVSAAAHLFQAHSAQAHYLFFFMDYAAMAAFQYGASLAHFFYTSEPQWRDSHVALIYVPGSAVVAWLSCVGCCFAKSWYQRPYPPQRKMFQVIPCAVAYLLDSSPIIHLLLTVPWTQEPHLKFHALHVGSMLISAFFFCTAIPERFFPGRCDIVGQGHQLFHLFVSLSTLFQQEALFQDYRRKRDTLLDIYRESQLQLACESYFVMVLCCFGTALFAWWITCRQLEREEKDK